MAFDELMRRFEEEIQADRLILPSLPEATRRLRALIDDPNGALTEIAALVARDVNCAARVVKVANSAHYARGRPVTSILAAIQRLGLAQVRALVTGLAVMQGVMQPLAPALRRHVGGVLEHSIDTAAAGQLLAERFTRLDALEAGLAGLVHDIGKLPVLRWAGRHPAILNHERHLRILLDAFSARVGRRILDRWGFPPALADVTAAGSPRGQLDGALSPYRVVIEWAHRLNEERGPRTAGEVVDPEQFRSRLGRWAADPVPSRFDLSDEAQPLEERRLLWAV